MGKKITVDLDQLNRLVEKKVAAKMKKSLNENTTNRKKRVVMTESQLVSKIEKIIKEHDRMKRRNRG